MLQSMFQSNNSLTKISMVMEIICFLGGFVIGVSLPLLSCSCSWKGNLVKDKTCSCFDDFL